ncbi:MAG: GAF domain-containing protein [Fimbriiglobus sp.]|nr:GAF domain-containing protein [Fimbriiglobus sp.]
MLDLEPDDGMKAAPRSRVLVFGPVPTTAQLLIDQETVRLADGNSVADALHGGNFVAVVADPVSLSNLLDESRRNALIVSHADRGVAFTTLDGKVEWANPNLKTWCGADPVGRPLLVALGSPTVSSATADPMAALARGESVSVRLHRTAGTPEYLDLAAHPVFAPDGRVVQFVALCRDVTAEVEQQRKLDALHQAGRELVELDAATIAEVSIPERVESLKDNLRRLIHDLLHYDIIELRLYDRRTNELRPLLEEGMTAEAAHRRLEALPEANGITGWVAHHRESYLCADAAADPRYLTGATGARSSLTVPLVFSNELVGTFNVESPRLNGFSEEDLQFTELFSKEIAAALHTLDLLSAQQTSAASHSVELVSREIALPIDEVIASAAVLLKQLGDRDDVIVNHLKKIVSNARQVKTCVRRVGDQAADVSVTPAPRPLTGKRVLVIEQDDRQRREAHRVLEGLGACAETVGTAAEGLALLAGVEYDAVLMEVRPVDLGGYDTFKSIRQTRPTVPVAMTTGFGYDAAHSIVKARADGMKYVLFKPYKPDQLVAAVLDLPKKS